MIGEKKIFEFDLGGIPFKIETGHIAKNAQSSLLVHYGETSVLLVVVVGDFKKDLDFLPLSVEYVEKLYAGGLISSSPYVKREGKPTDKQVLNARLIDHAIRSLFPKNFRNDTQVISQVLSYDKVNDPVLASIIGVNFALQMSGLPVKHPYGATKVGYIDNQVVINPTLGDLEKSAMDVFVSSTPEGVVSVEAEALDVNEDILKEGVKKAVEANNVLIDHTHKFLEKFGKKDFEYEEYVCESNLYEEIKNTYAARIEESIYKHDKVTREGELKLLKQELFEEYEDKVKNEEINSLDLNYSFESISRDIVREKILNEEKRPDSRGVNEIRPLSMEVGVLPRVHGSSLFSRGETQTLSIVTLGSDRDAQNLESIDGETTKRFFHHYNMPGYANGEVDWRLGFPNRRAIGHGNIGERAIEGIIAHKGDFPYTIRVVSEVTSSNGSTSMAATCSSTLALMDAGVPMSKVIGGIGVGLVHESNDRYKILTDIIGMEDFYGDMDFKICGSKEGITAIQLDNKMSGIPVDILFESIDRSKEARINVIEQMENCLASSRKETSKFAPKIKVLKIDPEKIGLLIGPGGKHIRAITEKTNVEINISEDSSGEIAMYAENEENFYNAILEIAYYTEEMFAGIEYDAKIVKVDTYGLIVQIIGTKISGLVHISTLNLAKNEDINNRYKVGDAVKVGNPTKDERGRYKFRIL